MPEMVAPRASRFLPQARRIVGSGDENVALSEVKGLSEYFTALDPVAKSRYESKLTYKGRSNEEIMLPDPYAFKEWHNDPRSWPDLTFGDTPGIYTRESLKAYKSLEAYDFFSKRPCEASLVSHY